MALARKAEQEVAPNPPPPEHEPSEDSSRTLIRPSMPEQRAALGDETTQRFSVQPEGSSEPRRATYPTLKSVGHVLPPEPPRSAETTSTGINIEVELDEAFLNDFADEAPPTPPTARTDRSKAQPTSVGASAMPAPTGAAVTAVAPDMGRGPALAGASNVARSSAPAPPPTAPLAPTFGAFGPAPNPAPPAFAPGSMASSVGARSLASAPPPRLSPPPPPPPRLSPPPPPPSSRVEPMSPSERALTMANLGTPGLFTAFFAATLLSTLLLLGYYFLFLGHYFFL
jgi:hypothetical protein